MRGRPPSGRKHIAVCLAEDNTLAAAYLRGVLERDPRFQITSELHYLKAPGACNPLPSVFVIDVGTLSSSLEAYLTVLRSHVRDARILLLTDEFRSRELHRFLSLGIQGLLSYSEVKALLRPALRAISEGDTWFPPDAASGFRQYPGTLMPDDLPGSVVPGIFTARERLILGFVERRLGNKEIASILEISESTVKFHLSNVFRKLGVRGRHLASDIAASPAFNCLVLTDRRGQEVEKPSAGSA
jgi:two-component system nitrate/nitrite response regulator NarP